MTKFEVVKGKSNIAAQMEAAMATNSGSFDNNFDKNKRPPLPNRSKAGRNSGNRAVDLLPRLRNGGYCAGISEKELLMMRSAVVREKEGRDVESNADNDDDKEEEEEKEEDIMDTIDPHGFMSGKYLMMRLAEAAVSKDVGDDDDEYDDEDYDEAYDDDEEYDDDDDYDDEEYGEEDEDENEVTPETSPALAFLRREGKLPEVTDCPISRIAFTASGHGGEDDQFPILRTPSSISWRSFKEFGQPNTAPWPEDEYAADRSGGVPGWTESAFQDRYMEGEMYSDEGETIQTEILPQQEVRTTIANEGHMKILRTFKSSKSKNNRNKNPKKGLSRAISTLRRKKNDGNSSKRASSSPPAAGEENEALLPLSSSKEKRVRNLRKRVRMMGKSRQSKSRKNKVSKSKNRLPGLDDIKEPQDAVIGKIVDEREGERAPNEGMVAAPSTPIKKLKNNRDDGGDQHLAAIVVTPVKVRLNNNAQAASSNNEKQSKAHYHGNSSPTNMVDTPTTAASDSSSPLWTPVRVTVHTDADTDRGRAALPPAMNAGGIVVRRTMEEYADPADGASDKKGCDPPGASSRAPFDQVLSKRMSTVLLQEGHENPSIHTVPNRTSPTIAEQPGVEDEDPGDGKIAQEEDEGSVVSDDRDIFQIKNSYKLRSALFERQTAIAATLAAKKKEDTVRVVLQKEDGAFASEESLVAEEKTPVVDEEPSISDEKAPVTEEKALVVETHETNDNHDNATDANGINDGNDNNNDDSEQPMQIVYDDCNHGVIGKSTDVLVEVTSAAIDGAYEDIEVINCMGLDRLDSHYIESSYDEAIRADDSDEGNEIEEEEEDVPELETLKYSNKEPQKSDGVSFKDIAAGTAASDNIKEQEDVEPKGISKPPLVKKRTSRGRLGPSKIREMMNRGNDHNETHRSKSRDRNVGRSKSREIIRNRGKSAGRSSKIIGGRFRKKKQNVDASVDDAIGNTSKVQKDSEHANTLVARPTVNAGGSGVSVRGLSNEARATLKKAKENDVVAIANARGNASVHTSHTSKGLSSEARKTLERTGKSGRKKKKKFSSPSTRKESEIFVPILITPVISPKRGNKKSYHGLSQEAQAALDGEEEIDFGRSKRKGHHGLSKKAKHVLARDDDAAEDFDAALEQIEVSVGLHMDKNSEDDDDGITAPQKLRQSRSPAFSDESDYTSSSDEEEIAASKKRRARVGRSRRNRRGRRSRSVTRSFESDYTSNSEEDSHYESDGESTYYHKGTKDDDTDDESSVSEDDGDSSGGSSGRRSIYTESSQSEEEESDDEWDKGDRRGVSRNAPEPLGKVSSFKPFGIPQEEIMEDLKDAFEDTTAHVTAQIKMIKSRSPLIKSFDFDTLAEGTMLAGVVRGRSERSDYACRGAAASSPSRKRGEKRIERQGRPPRPEKSKKKKNKKESSGDLAKFETEIKNQKKGAEQKQNSKPPSSSSYGNKCDPYSDNDQRNNENKSKETKAKKINIKMKKGKAMKRKGMKEALSKESKTKELKIKESKTKETNTKKKKTKEKKTKEKKTKEKNSKKKKKKSSAL